MSGAPIGIFDSGVGGLSVWRQVVHHLPDESVIYLADQAHVPYGQRSAQEIRAPTWEMPDRDQLPIRQTRAMIASAPSQKAQSLPTVACSSP